MAGFMGTALKVTWSWSGGTLPLADDYRTFNYTPSVAAIDDSAGADAAMSYVKGITSGALSWAGKIQSGSVAAYASAMAAGNVGTVTFYPQGLAAGQYRGTVPAWCNGFVYDIGYNDTANVSCSWMQNGLLADGTVA